MYQCMEKWGSEEKSMNILVTRPVDAYGKKRLEEAAAGCDLLYCTPQDITETHLRNAEIILGNLKEPKKLQLCRKLKWIQLGSAGTEGYCEPGVLPEGAVLTNATGAYGLAIAEHMIGCLFELRKNLHIYYKNQLSHKWKWEGMARAIEGSTVVVLGLGDIGSAFGKKMKALGCRVIGVKRRCGEKPEWLDRLCTAEELDEILPQADVVAMSLPGNEATRHMLSRERIALLKENAIVLNAGRGISIDTEALTEALIAGKIGGAALDVTDPEPLPEGHRLWDAPNTILTPHVSYALQESEERITDIFIKNLNHFFSGEELENVVDIQTGYKK